MKINVGVFFGGKSVEHEVSVISGLQAFHAFDTEKYNPIPLYLTKEHELYFGKEIGNIEAYKNIPALLMNSERVIIVNNGNKALLVRYPGKKFGNNVLAQLDVALPVLHGTNVEDGAFQGYLQTLGIPYAGCDVLSSALGMDKYAMKAILKDNGIPVLDCVVLDVKSYAKDAAREISKVESKLSYPVIVKPINLGSSIGIRVAKDHDGLIKALEYAFEFSIKVLVEKAITNLKEVNIAVLGDYESAQTSECEQPIGSEEILSFTDKYAGGAKDSSKGGMASLKRIIPAPVSSELKERIQSNAVKAFQALGCSGVARIDFMIDQDSNELYLTEINTIPGSLAFYLWEPVGIKYPVLLDKIIGLALKREREKKQLNFTYENNLLSSANFSSMKGGKV